MTPEQRSTFKSLFSLYCRQEINNGKCGKDDCEFCYVNKAYEEIFCLDSPKMKNTNDKFTRRRNLPCLFIKH